MNKYEKYKPSGIDWIGEVPEHWDRKKIGRCFQTIGSGTTPEAGKTDYYEEGTINWINTGDLNDGDIIECEKQITQEAFDKHSVLKIYPKGTVLIALYGATIGKTGFLLIEGATNQACCALADSVFIIPRFTFLIVANKFQVGFSEKMLHTMFVDKALHDRNAVQTISRLNRVYPGKKNDTLTVDFTNSYDKIIKAFKKYQSNVESHKEANPDDLYKIKDELLKRGIFTLEDVEDCIRLFNSDNASDVAPLSVLLTKIKGILQSKADGEKQREFRTLLARYVSLFGFIRALFRLRLKDKILIDFNIFATLLYKKLDPTMSAEDLEAEIAKVKLKTFDIEKIAEGVQEPEGEDDDDSGNGGGQTGNVTSVRPMATVEEVVIAINLRFKERVSPEGVTVVENYLQALQKDDDLKTTIKNNLTQDERQVYDLVIKGIMDKLYTDYIINHSPQHYSELTKDNIQGFINQSAYKMLREIMRGA